MAQIVAANETWDPRISHEIEVTTCWAEHLEEAVAEPVAKQFGNAEIWLIEGLLSTGECAALIEQAEGHGYGTTNYPKRYRGNLRLIAHDDSLAEAVWQRLQPLVPASVSCDGAEWDATGLNECWRLAKYHPGDRFAGHCDAAFRRDRQEQSMFTVNIYMNEGFDGGCTRFYFGKDSKAPADLSVEPRAGLCLLFRQPPGRAYYHDGEQLATGVKYLFRSDVMYRRRDSTDACGSQAVIPVRASGDEDRRLASRTPQQELQQRRSGDDRTICFRAYP